MKSKALQKHSQFCLPDITSTISAVTGQQKQNYTSTILRIPRHRTATDFSVTRKNPGWLTGVAFHDKNGEQVSISNAAGSSHHSIFFYEFTDIESLWKTEWTVYNENGKPVPYEDSPLQRSIRTGKTVSEILTIHLKNGEERCVFFVSRPLRTTRTWNRFIMSSLIDVTSESLQLSKVEPHSTLSVLSWIVNEHGNLLFANTAFYDYFGLDKKESTGKKLSSLVSGAVSNKLYNKYLTVLSTGKSMQSTERLKLGDGNSFTARTIMFPVNAPEGKIMIAGHSVHLPDSQRSQKEKDKFTLLSQATSDAIWEWDMQSGHIYRSGPLLKMIGYNKKFLKGVGWWLRNIHPDDRSRVLFAIKDTVKKHKPSWQEEYRFRSADGSYKHVKDRGFVVHENGVAVKMIGSLTDITKVKELEQELMKEKLRREIEVAETIVRVQEQERAHIGHELHDNVNQILCSAKLYAQMLKLADQDQQVIKHKAMEYITLAVDEIRKLSKELTVPRLKEGLKDSIQSLINDMHESSPVTFNFSYDEECESTSAEKKVTIYRMIQEQVKNILKHSRATVASISLHKINTDLRLIIWDNGIGFNTHQVARGIGLSNMQDRLSLYSGALEIVSAPEEGCKLLISLPA